MRAGVAVVLLVSALSPLVAEGQVYEWVDEQDTVHYTTELERVPERFRAGVRLLRVPQAPGQAPAEASHGPQPLGVATFRFTSGAPILVQARVNGTGPLTLVLDTGADRTLVAPAALLRLGIATPNTFRAQVKGVTGASPADVVWVSSVEVGGLSVGPLPIVAHDADLEHADGLLGRDFLSFFTVTIDTAASVVTLTRR